MEFLQGWKAICRYKWMILILCLFSVVSGVGLTYTLTERYDATTVVLVRPQKDVMISAPNTGSNSQLLNYPVSTYRDIESPGKTYIEIIKSPGLIQKIVQRLGMDNPQPPPPDKNFWKRKWNEFKRWARDFIIDAKNFLKYGRTFESDPLTDAIEEVQENLNMATTSDTYIFHITYSGESPRQAAEVANVSADIFIDYISRLNKKDSTDNLVLLKSKLDESKQKLMRAREDLQTFKEERSVFVLEDEYAEYLKLIAKLETILEKVEIKLASAKEKYIPDHPSVKSLNAERKRLIQSIENRKREFQDLAFVEKKLGILEHNLKLNKKTYDLIEEEYLETTLKHTKGVQEVAIVSAAIPPITPAKPNKLQYGVFSFGLALLIGIGLALILDYLSLKLRSIDDTKRVLDLPVLATIPDLKTKGSLF